MQEYKLLSIDESGKASFNHLSSLFILSGTIIPEGFKGRLERQIKKLKKKFFADEDIIFHARDMCRRKGPFVSLQDTEKDLKFWAEFISILNNPKVNFIFTIANKKNAEYKQWKRETILNRSYQRLLEQFVINHLSDKWGGKIVVESNPMQDTYLIKAHSRIQSTGIEKNDISAKDYREKITSLSLVNKLNLDIDVQIADIFAYVAGTRYRMDVLGENISLNKIEKMKKRLIDRKFDYKRNPATLDVII